MGVRPQSVPALVQTSRAEVLRPGALRGRESDAIVGGRSCEVDRSVAARRWAPPGRRPIGVYVVLSGGELPGQKGVLTGRTVPTGNLRWHEHEPAKCSGHYRALIQSCTDSTSGRDSDV